ncbi:hypothetical protein BT69DRAFT_1220188 [Atractiella rhizophila]|nr:hypothetical protein BT69DRAFT_1220188 [Atractiella rhizophila]
MSFLGDRLYAKYFPVQQPCDSFTPLHARSYLDPSNAGSSYSTLPNDTYSPSPDLVCVATVSRYARDNIFRQFTSLYVLTAIGIFVLYFSVAGLSYYFLFDKRLRKHPKFLKNQEKQEIIHSLQTFLPLDALTTPWFLGEVRGHSMIYDGFRDGPWGSSNLGSYGYIVFSSLLFLFLTDLGIYWAHRALHWPSVYKRLHKPHHKWIIPTPWASHAFHPLDGYAQSLPYHIFVYVFPLNKFLFIGLFIFVNVWSILIHDSDMISDHPAEYYINGPAHHTLHHMYFTVNYGQYFTWADRYWSSFRKPETVDDPIHRALEIIAAEEKAKTEKLGLHSAESSTALSDADSASTVSSSSSLPATPLDEPLSTSDLRKRK